MNINGTIYIEPTRHALRRAMSRLHLPHDLGLIHSLLLPLKEGYLSKNGDAYILDFPDPPVRLILAYKGPDMPYAVKTLIDRVRKEKHELVYGRLTQVIWRTKEQRINVKGRKIRTNYLHRNYQTVSE